jgi:hypothetical protein
MATFPHELDSWTEVEKVTSTPSIKTCIRSDGTDIGPNHDRAQETWEQHYPKALRYFCLIDGDRYRTEGYIRILQLTTVETMTPSMWAVDFAKPLCYLTLESNAVDLVKPLCKEEDMTTGPSKRR